MMLASSKKKVTRAIYIGISLLFLIVLIGNELFWRYSAKLDITIHAKLRNSVLLQRELVLHEFSDSPVDTSRREYKDIHHGKTDIAIWLEKGHDTIHLSLAGKYLSEVRTLHISSDSSTQIILIPNTIQGLPSGQSTILYLKNDSVLTVIDFRYFIGDVDHDGSEEVNIPESGGWMKLNTQTGDWIPAQLKTTP
jgi:hypothetical protein